MLPKRYQDIDNPHVLFSLVMDNHSYYDHGRELLTARGKEVLAIWAKINSMSFENPKYMARWRAEMKEKMTLTYELFPKRRKKPILLPPPPPVSLYCDYPECERKAKKETRCEVHINTKLPN